MQLLVPHERTQSLDGVDLMQSLTSFYISRKKHCPLPSTVSTEDTVPNLQSPKGIKFKERICIVLQRVHRTNETVIAPRPHVYNPPLVYRRHTFVFDDNVSKRVSTNTTT
jgi:hypothetical protein